MSNDSIGCDRVNLEKLNPFYVLSRGSLAAEFTVYGVEERRSHTARDDATQKLTRAEAAALLRPREAEGRQCYRVQQGTTGRQPEPQRTRSH